VTDVSVYVPRRHSAATWITGASVGAGLVLLLARPAVSSELGWTVPIVIVLFGAVLALGVGAPVDVLGGDRIARGWTSAAVFATGVLVFASGRVLAAGHTPARPTGVLILLNTFAAVAEEALFRRAAFSALLAAGPVCAITGSALLFGLAHVTVYGWWAFPMDLAAGIVLGWQRWASGNWAVPAATHALADLMVVI
jgi:membrane protease YdiL (CAAX protease family)